MTPPVPTEARVRMHATISPCGTYRYWLERSWADTGKGFVNFIMLNPSTADAEKDDATIRKCIGFAKRWGYDGLHVVNLFALRSTSPNALYSHPDPVGPENDTYIRAGVMSAEKTIIAWGAHGKIMGRADKVLPMLDRVEALVFNADDSPRHLLYVPYEIVPYPMNTRSHPMNTIGIVAAMAALSGGVNMGRPIYTGPEQRSNGTLPIRARPSGSSTTTSGAARARGRSTGRARNHE